jgi:hypothetical protein
LKTDLMAAFIHLIPSARPLPSARQDPAAWDYQTARHFPTWAG